MLNFRKYGRQPYEIAVIHGGPGGAGEMAPVAVELSKDHSVLEPLQTNLSFVGQLEELKAILTENAQLPVTLIGHSYGSLLSFVFAGRHPTLIKKLILLSSAVFEEQYALEIMSTRLKRLEEKERKKAEDLLAKSHDLQLKNKDEIFSQIEELISQTDSYDPLSCDNEHLETSYEIYEKVWKEVHALRLTGELLGYGKTINCRVVAIHGDYDPRPYEGIQIPLAHTLKDFKFILLEKCAHYPWLERQAKDRFYEILEREIRN
ncbi:MAG: alpha/beta hydrolase [Alphaproteobacteria bacterium]|nr:alpha/beta hydrolase [Alphaproteobacteria bacterium]